MPDALAASGCMVAQSKVGKTGTNKIIQRAEYCSGGVCSARRKAAATAPPAEGTAGSVISHAAVSTSRGEAARKEVDEHGPDGAEPRTPCYKGVCTLSRLQRTGDEF